MNDILSALTLARANLGRSVVRVNENAAGEAAGKVSAPLLFGVKNTDALSAPLIDRLRLDRRFLWIAIDRMADFGRSVDTDLINPLTYRAMTGSTSGGCVNILKGIEDICIGTDGGGSVLAPALSCNLWSFMGKGVGLTAGGEALSTDGLSFTPGVGVIGNNLDAVTDAAETLMGAPFGPSLSPVRLAMPAPGCLALPDGRDGAEELTPLLSDLPDDFSVSFHAFADPYSREETVPALRKLAESADVLLSFEGPVDVFSYDETIPRRFGGSAPARVAGTHSKAFIKSVNMAGWSAFTVPSAQLAAGFVVACAPGRAAAAAGLRLASWLTARVRLPEVFTRYYLEHQKRPRPCAYR